MLLLIRLGKTIATNAFRPAINRTERTQRGGFGRPFFVYQNKQQRNINDIGNLKNYTAPSSWIMLGLT